MEKIEGLTSETAVVFNKITKLQCIEPLWLCGGTSISLQLHHRLSEDLDFELLGTRRERPDFNYAEIRKEIEEQFPGSHYEHLGEDHFQWFLPNNVKLSFFRPKNSVPSLTEGFKMNNLKTPSLQESLGMKIYVANARYVYRDYYDIYCLLKEGCDLNKGIDYALRFSRHQLHTKQVLTNLLSPELYQKEKDFDERLRPVYNVSSKDIQLYIIENLKNCREELRRKMNVHISDQNEETIQMLRGFAVPEANIKELLETGKTHVIGQINVREKQAYDTDVLQRNVDVILEYHGLAVNAIDPVTGKNLGALDQFAASEGTKMDLSGEKKQLERELTKGLEQGNGRGIK